MIVGEISGGYVTNNYKDSACAPIVLFVYNRPWHTEQTLNALMDNCLADQSVLYIFSDGPGKNVTLLDLQKIKEVRRLVRFKRWCKEVHIIESDKNMGLAESIVSGVTKIVNKYGKIIVVEDDLVTSKGFLKYMNDALTLYESEEKVMHISGYWFPVKYSHRLPPTFFYNTASCWGWGTWQSAWNLLNVDSAEIIEKISTMHDGVYKFNIEDGYDFFSQLKANAEGRLKTWAINWYGTIFLGKGFSLHPNRSFVNNIGNDLSGVNSGQTNIFNWRELADEIVLKKIPLCESKKARKMIKDKFTKEKTVKGVFVNLLKKIIPSRIKRKIIYCLDLESQEHPYYYLKKMPRYVPTEILFSGKKIKIVDSASFLFSYTEIFEREIYQFESDNIAPYIIDGGANIGMSILYFKKLFPQARIIAFEPDKMVFDTLAYNIDTLALKNIELINKGLWNCDGRLDFFSEGADGGRVAVKSDCDNISKIETVSLRKYIQDKTVEFLKIDIEGAETIVLEDIDDLLVNVERIFIEYHSFAEEEQTLHRIFNILKKHSYRLYINSCGATSVTPFSKVEIPENGMDMQLNIFAFKE